MRFGVSLPNSGPLASPSTISLVAREAEALGYASVWVHDHIERKSSQNKAHFAGGAYELWGNEENPVPNFYESLTTLSYLAGQTHKVALGTAIIVLPLRNPVILAKQTSVLDVLSGGRLILGVGRGGGPYLPKELAAVGEANRFKSVQKVIKEWIDVLKVIWTQDKASYSGELIQFSDLEIFPKPVQKPHIPLYYGTFSGAGLKRVGESADGWIPMYMSPGELVEKKQIIDEHARNAGRDPSKIGIASVYYLSIDNDAGQAVKRATKTLSMLSGHSALTESPRPGDGMLQHMFEKGRNLLGDPSTIIKYVEAYEKAGLGHMILRIVAFGADDMLNQMRRFEREVMNSF